MPEYSMVASWRVKMAMSLALMRLPEDPNSGFGFLFDPAGYDPLLAQLGLDQHFVAGAPLQSLAALVLAFPQEGFHLSLGRCHLLRYSRGEPSAAESLKRPAQV
jgi:hypothetical protein